MSQGIVNSFHMQMNPIQFLNFQTVFKGIEWFHLPLRIAHFSAD